MKRLWEEGVVSHYLEAEKEEEEWFDVEEKESSKPFVPEDPEQVAAISEIVAEGTCKLYHFPQWKKKFVHEMVREMGADGEILRAMDKVEEMPTQKQEDEWDSMTESAGVSSKAKAKPATQASGGYRPKSP